jgi:hypothetical protein
MGRGEFVWRRVASAPLGRRDGTRGKVKTAQALEQLEPQAPLAPRDEAIFLLHTAAEVEHALLVEYLYGWFSAPEAGAVLRVIAIQEMAHFLCIQNVLRALGAPLNFDREDYPFRSEFYPFHFRLEPLSLASLARYVIAEMPEKSGLKLEEIELLKTFARLDAGVQHLNRVGALYDRLIKSVAALDTTEFAAPALEFQADPKDWKSDGTHEIVRLITSQDDALKALRDIAIQGEGAETSTGDSHFEKFLTLYKQVLATGDPRPLGPLPASPTTSARRSCDAELEAARIDHPIALPWAQMLNHRYRILLTSLMHFLHLPGAIEKTPLKAELKTWAFQEMALLKLLAALLGSLPAKDKMEAATDTRAGPPFELPYALVLPPTATDGKDPERWRLQRDLVVGSGVIAARIRDVDKDEERIKLLGKIEAIDAKRKDIIDKAIG